MFSLKDTTLFYVMRVWDFVPWSKVARHYHNKKTLILSEITIKITE